VIPSGAGKGNVIINNSSASFDSNLDLNGFDQNINGLSATGADMTRAKVINSTGTATLTVGNNNTSSTYAGSIGGGAGVLGLGKTGTGTQTLTGSLNYNGDTTISAGTLHVNTATAGTAAGNVTGAGTLIKSGPGKLTIGAANLNNLTINAGSVLAMSPRSGVPDLASSRKTLYVHGTFNLDAAGTLDTANNDIAIDNSTFNDVFGQVLAGFGNPNGPGITSSTSDGSQIHALFDNALVGITDWNGASVGANAIVGKYTYFGDANIDGQVTGDDYGVIDANLDTTPPWDWVGSAAT
jgi:autotransporter-associated beta strand protein